MTRIVKLKMLQQDNDTVEQITLSGENENSETVITN